MTDRPEPMTPPDCDLRCFPRMPLLGQQLFDSDFDAKATAEEFRAAVRLWWAAWQQVPAASLPDDDVVLCKLAGLGVATCAPGASCGQAWPCTGSGAAQRRLYHPVLAEEAIRAYNCKLSLKMSAGSIMSACGAGVRTTLKKLTDRYHLKRWMKRVSPTFRNPCRNGERKRFETRQTIEEKANRKEKPPP